MIDNRKIKVRMVFKEEKQPYLLDISSLLYNFELVHDFSLLIYADDYRNYKFTQYFWYRNRRPLKREHKIRTFKIIKKSPLTVELILNSVVVLSGAIWGIIQTIEKISNWKLNKEKLKLEIQKLKTEINIASYEEQRVRMELEQRLHEKETLRVFVSLLRRLEKNPITLDDISIIEIVDGVDNHENGR